MDIYPFDPKTGERLRRNGFPVNPIHPMTQTEVDTQCNIVSKIINYEANIPPKVAAEAVKDNNCNNVAKAKELVEQHGFSVTKV